MFSIVYNSCFATSIKINDIVNISTKDKPYKVLVKRDAGDESRFGPLWYLELEEIETGNNRHGDYIMPDGTSIFYKRKLSKFK